MINGLADKRKEFGGDMGLHSTNKFWKDRRYVLFALVSAFFFVQCGATKIPLDDQAKEQKILAMYQAYKSKSFPNIPDISVMELLKLKSQEKIVLVDVREPREQRVSMIPDAISVSDFEKNFQHYKNEKVVLYCTIGYRSGLYARKLLKKNVKAMNLAGSVLAWAHAGKTFVGPNGETKRVHVYSKKWNLLPREYEPVW